jgi:hypothetical protein
MVTLTRWLSSITRSYYYFGISKSAYLGVLPMWAATAIGSMPSGEPLATRLLITALC